MPTVFVYKSILAIGGNVYCCAGKGRKREERILPKMEKMLFISVEFRNRLIVVKPLLLERGTENSDGLEECCYENPCPSGERRVRGMYPDKKEEIYKDCLIELGQNYYKIWYASKGQLTPL